MSAVGKLEAIIFSEGAEVKVSTVCSMLSIQASELATLVSEYNATGRGTVLVLDESKVLMRTAGEYAGVVEELRQSEQEEEVSKAGLEVLAIVLYSEAGSSTASEVEQVRGVNSGYTLRQLTRRGFLSKTRTGMSFVYAPTSELLSFLGVTALGALPSLAAVQQQIRDFKHNNNDSESDKQN